MVQVLYVATKLTPGVTNYKKTLDAFQFPHQALAQGQNWGGWRFRMKTYMEACQKEASDAILVLTDADDVLAIRHHTPDLQAAYENFNKPIVVSAESVCFPNNCKNK